MFQSGLTFAANRTGGIVAINLREDDRPLLSLFHETFRVGQLKDVGPYRSSKAAVSWRVGRREELKRLVYWFDQSPPRGRAGDVYTRWRDLVMLEAPNEEIAARYVLALASLGNVRTTTLKIFNETQYKGIIGKIP